MAKRFKQKLSRVIPTIQFCRPDKSETSSRFPGNTVPTAIYRMSPVNPKSFDISFPSFTAPAPPSTPDRSFTMSHHVGKSRLSGREESSQYTRKKDRRSYVVSHKSHGRTIAPAAAKPSKKVCSEETVAPLLADASVSLSDCYSSSEFFSERSPLLETSETNPTLVPQRLMPREAEGKVRESVAVVKRSEDPREDFSRSMWEMVVEKEMFTAEDLEQLLLCFLSLNSRKYHPIIVEAFAEIWQLLFSNNQQRTPSRRQHVSKSARDQ